jgi:hypothetical protein
MYCKNTSGGNSVGLTSGLRDGAVLGTSPFTIAKTGETSLTTASGATGGEAAPGKFSATLTDVSAVVFYKFVPLNSSTVSSSFHVIMNTNIDTVISIGTTVQRVTQAWVLPIVGNNATVDYFTSLGVAVK